MNELLAGVPLIDGHNDLPDALRVSAGYSVAGLDAVRAELQTDIPRLRQGNVGAQFWSVWVPSDLPEQAAVVATLEQVDAVYRLVTAYPQVFGFAATAYELERVWASGRIASLMGIEGGHSIAESLGALRMFARLGVRYMTLTHNDDTAWAASATGLRQTTGLNDTGRAIVAEMNRIGMIVDLSHTAESTQLDVLAATTAPVIFSHSSARAVTDHPRNVTDRVLEKLADNGGVLQVTFVPGFVSARPDATLADVADHVEHARAVAGVDHIGIGGDYDGTPVQPQGLEDVSTYPALFDELATRGWSAGDLQKLAGRNILRVMRAVEDAATEPLWPGSR
ncbi:MULTISPECIES: dipeptidase [Cryobacterium]|nr:MULTISPECIES: dipeptidase [Cryobacterium]